MSIAITGALLMLSDGPRQLTLRILGERIAGIGGSPQPGDRVIDLTGHAVFPGLINAHEHLELNVYPRIKLRTTYDNASEWGRDMLDQLDAPGVARLRAIPLADRLFIGGLKNLLSGATTVLHHDELFRPLRSPRFPVRVVRRYSWAHSLAFEDDIFESYEQTPADVPWIIHLAEGTDTSAQVELFEIEQKGCLGPNTVLVHGVGLTNLDIQHIIAVGAGLIWCPETNRFLLGRAHYHAPLLGRMALGSDSRLTGSLDLLEELKVAKRLSGLPAHRQLDMVLGDAARLLRLPYAGRIVRDAPADLIAVANENRDPYEVLIEAHRSNLRLVMVGGQVRIADLDLRHLFSLTRTPTDPARLDGVPKLIARDLSNRLYKTRLMEPGLEIV